MTDKGNNESPKYVESDIEKVSEERSADEKTSTLVAGLRRANQLISTYQPLLTVVTALATLVFLQMNFGYGTLASYRDAAQARETNRRLTDFYRQLGDRLVNDQEYDEATAAYRSALSLQPADPGSNYGLAKAQIFKPKEGQRYSDPQLSRIKLDYLGSLFKDDADIEAIRCEVDYDLNDSSAETACKKSIALNPNLYFPYINLGFICLKQFDFDCAQQYFQKAVELRPNSADAKGNLGYSQLLQLNTEGAIARLEEAEKLATSVDQHWALGDAYRYSSQIDEAIDKHESGLWFLQQKDIEKEAVVGGRWLVVTMPISRSEDQTNGFHQYVATIEDKVIVLRYALTIDYALKGDFAAAQREFEKARKSDGRNDFGDYFVNRAAVAANVLKVSDKTKLWFKQRGKQACTREYYCKEVDALFH